MKKYLAKYFKTDYLLMGVIILLILFLAIGAFNRYQSQNELKNLIDKIKAVYMEAQQLALRAEKFQGQDIYSYGVYFDEIKNSLVICADLNGDLACDFNERYQESLLIDQDKFAISEVVPVNYLRFQKIDGVCFADMCELTGDQAVMKITFANPFHYAEVAIDTKSGEPKSYIYE